VASALPSWRWTSAYPGSSSAAIPRSGDGLPEVGQRIFARLDAPLGAGVQHDARAT
jgi:hypothetical protein